MLMKSENDEVISQVRETVQRVCEEFDGEYCEKKIGKESSYRVCKQTDSKVFSQV